MRTQYGFSLLELLIVLALSSVFLLALHQLFFHYQNQYQYQQAALKTQASTHLALHLLHDHLQNAGEAGCNHSAQLQVHNQVAHLPIVPGLMQAYAVYGHAWQAQTWDPPLPAALLGKVANNTDVVLVEHAAAERAHLSRAMTDVFDAIYIHQNADFAVGDTVLIADCTHADLFQISHLEHTDAEQILWHTTPENRSPALDHVYTEDAQVMRWQVDAYYLAKTQRDETRLALYRHSLLPMRSPIELVAGLAQFSVQYAVLKQGQPYFVHAAQVDDWSLVRGLYLHILGMTPIYTANPHPYVWLGSFVHPEVPGFYWPGEISVPLYNQGV